jgi:hypothetical protein
MPRNGIDCGREQAFLRPPDVDDRRRDRPFQELSLGELARLTAAAGQAFAPVAQAEPRLLSRAGPAKQELQARRSSCARRRAE